MSLFIISASLITMQINCLKIDILALTITKAFLVITVVSEVKSLSRVRLFETPWTIAYQAPPSMRFSRQEYWSGLPFVSPGDLPDPGIKPVSLALQADSLPLSHLGSLLRGLMSLNDLAFTQFPSTSLSFSYSGLLSVLKR